MKSKLNIILHYQFQVPVLLFVILLKNPELNCYSKNTEVNPPNLVLAKRKTAFYFNHYTTSAFYF